MRELLDDLLREYELAGRSALPQARSRVKRLKTHLGHERALYLRADRVRAFMVHRQLEEAKPATINREIEFLRTVFRLAADSKKLPENNARRGFFERGDFLAVVGKVKDAGVRDFLE